MDVLLLAAVFVAVAVLTVAAARNGLASLRQAVRDAWAALDGELQRRYELVSQLAAAARATGQPVPPGLAAALAARNRAAIAFNPAQLAAAEADLTAGLDALFRDPPASLADLAGYGPARRGLINAEAAIAAARRRYNDAAGDYNDALGSFPHAWAAAAFGFRPQPPFAAEQP